MRVTFAAMVVPVLLSLAVTAAPAIAQQAAAAPATPVGVKVPPLPVAPVEYETAEGQNIRIVVLARDLEHPWSIAFLPDGAMLVTERAGRLRIIRNGVLDPEPIEGLPKILVEGLSGLLDLALHPGFAENHWVYFTYVKPLPDDESSIALARGRWDGHALRETRDLFVAGTETIWLSRIVFGRDGMIYLSTFGGDPQKPDNLGGKILRLTDEGGVPSDNPFVGRPGYRPEIYTLGHRSTHGLAIHPQTGAVWQVEMGPNGGDELNVLKPGANYGWPLVSLGRTYAGPWQSEHFEASGFERPISYWTPSISISGLAFYTGDQLPIWRGNVFVGGLRYGEIPGTGQLQRIVFNDNMEEVRREALLIDLRHRIRDVRQGPDGLLYLLTDEDAGGGVLRIEPVLAK